MDLAAGASALTPETVLKLVLSSALGLASMYLLYAGRRDRDWRKFVWAAACALASLLLY